MSRKTPAALEQKLRRKVLDELQTLSPNIQVIYADLSSPVRDLAPIFARYHIVISATGFSAGPGSQLRLCDAALAAAALDESVLERYLPWQFGVDYAIIGMGSSQPLFDEQLQVREKLRSQESLKWTITSTGIFTSFLFEPFFGVVHFGASAIDEGGSNEAKVGEGDQAVAIVRALGSWSNRITITSARDIGRLAAYMLLSPPPPGCDIDGVQHIAGDTFTFADLAVAIESRGWTVRREILLEEDLLMRKEENKRTGQDEANKVINYQIIWARGKGVAWDTADTWSARAGIEMEDLEKWIDRNLPSSRR